MVAAGERALRAALATAEARGLSVAAPVVLYDGSSLLVHPRPDPVVARVLNVTAIVRPGDAWLRREVMVAGCLATRGAPVVAPARRPERGALRHRRQRARAARHDEEAERRYVAAIAVAGATWWHEYIEPDTPLPTVRDRIAGGPLRADG